MRESVNAMLSWLRRLFLRSTDTQRASTVFASIRWLDAAETPFGVRLLDCRPVVQSIISATSDRNGANFLFSNSAVSGHGIAGSHPEQATVFPASLTYAGSEATLPDGPLFVSSRMEEKWNVYHFAGKLYFVRSWTGAIRYVAHLDSNSPELSVVAIEADLRHVFLSRALGAAQVLYLLKSYGFGQTSPHPVPSFLGEQAMAKWSYSEYGCRGLFAEPLFDDWASDPTDA
jgi:hypothetical protein